ncbi:MAG: hypothetical protein ACPLVF_02085 [Thermovenabulum sp.]|uniref:hypothetical protein n=1 Tax=Thermovenabulum sp. TaxID=3100335 RepID=UPI003C7B1EFE
MPRTKKLKDSVTVTVKVERTHPILKEKNKSEIIRKALKLYYYLLNFDFENMDLKRKEEIKEEIKDFRIETKEFLTKILDL